MQWESEYQTSSVFKWLKRGWMPNGPVFKCHLYIKQARPFKSRTNGSHLASLCTGSLFVTQIDHKDTIALNS